MLKFKVDEFSNNNNNYYYYYNYNYNYNNIIIILNIKHTFINTYLSFIKLRKLGTSYKRLFKIHLQNVQ